MAYYSIKTYIAPIWNPDNGKDITTYLRNSGEVPVIFTFGGEEVETTQIYYGVYKNNGLKRQRIPNISCADINVACIYYYIDDNVVTLELCCNGSNSNKLLFKDIYTDTFSQSTNSWSTTELHNYSSLDFSKIDNTDNSVLNINTPYLPIFNTQELVDSYIEDPTDATIYVQALNYYDPAQYSQPHSELREYFRPIPSKINSLIDSIFSVENPNYNNFIGNSLDTINNLINARISTIDYNTPIEENEQKVLDSLTKLVKLNNMQLINNPSENAKQVNFPNKAPFIPCREYSPFTIEQMTAIKEYYDGAYTVDNTQGYFLYCAGKSIRNDRIAYSIYSYPFANNYNNYNYSNRVLSNSSYVDQKPQYYLNANNKNNIYINRAWGSDVYALAWFYPDDNTIEHDYSWTINHENFSRKSNITIGGINNHVPFYCSGDVYVAYRETEDDEYENLLWLKKDDNYTITETTGVNSALVHIKPIVMLYNRYQFSFLNGWDGNKLEMGDYYLIAPQLGAGIKESDNSFSGVVMGTKLKDINKGEERLMGIFGQYHGRQSFFLNSDDGSAIFGLDKQGQLTIDPTQNKAMIYSGNYWNEYKYDGKPANYYDSNRSGQGMLIDLTTPEIRFGNGNFVVDADGNTSIAGGGGLAGWKITDTAIQSGIPVAEGRLVLDSGATCTGVDSQGNKTYTYGQAKIYSGLHNTLASTSAGFYLSDDGLSIGPSFKINTTGTFYIGYNATTFDCTNLNDPKHYTIGGSANSIYLGTEGIRLGNNFAVDNDGNIVTRHLVVSLKNGSTYDAIGCWIGDWQFASNSNGSYLSGVHQVSSNQWDRIWLSTEGIIKAEKWSQEPPSGTPEVMWQINPDGTASFKGSVTISNLGGFDIGGNTGNYITNGNISGSAIIANSIKIDNKTFSNSYTCAALTGVSIDSDGIVHATGNVTKTMLCT